jgi:hypothetical protein
VKGENASLPAVDTLQSGKPPDIRFKDYRIFKLSAELNDSVIARKTTAKWSCLPREHFDRCFFILQIIRRIRYE